MVDFRRPGHILLEYNHVESAQKNKISCTNFNNPPQEMTHDRIDILFSLDKKIET